MKLIPALLLLSPLSFISAQTQTPALTSDTVVETSVTKIAFGSCSNPRSKRKPIFETVLNEKPDLFIFLGDNIYGDTEDMAVMKKKYEELRTAPGYKELQEQTRVLATWDDHDYGINDGGKSYPKREESQQVFLDFFNEPADSVRRTRPGIYTSYTFGKAGQRVQVILLDTRYFRDELPHNDRKAKRKPGTVGWYSPTKDSSKTLLGDAQWTWLEAQLQVEAEVRIIASSIQVLAYEKGMENWGNVPHEQQRLFDLLKKHKAHRTLAISGDVHFAELSKVSIGDYPFYDLTSSGLTNVSPSWAKAKNSFRVGKAHAEANTGLIEIDWEEKALHLNIVNKAGKKLIEEEIPFADLEFQ